MRDRNTIFSVRIYFESIAMKMNEQILVNIYRLHTIAAIDSFINKLKNILTYKDNNFPNCEITLLGDLNINLLQNDAKANKLIDLIQGHGLFSGIDLATRYDQVM